MTFGRDSVLPRHVIAGLTEDERVAVEVLEMHLYLRGRGPRPALELLDDGTVAVFLTTGRIQVILRLLGARKRGKDFARLITKEILPSLGLIEDTGLAKKPCRDGREGGRRAQPRGPHSYWWPLYRLCVLTKLVTPRCGAYPERP